MEMCIKGRVLKVISDTIVDGPGLRTSVYFAGCGHHCKACHNPESWDFAGGHETTVGELVDEIKEYGNGKVTLSGGDPMYQYKFVERLLGTLRDEIPGVDIWICTGFTMAELESDPKYAGILKLANAIVDGPFVLELKDETLEFRGSSNQKINYLRDRK